MLTYLLTVDPTILRAGALLIICGVVWLLAKSVA